MFRTKFRLAGFNGLIEDLVFYRNVSLYPYYIHIPEVTAQTVAFGYLLLWWECSATSPRCRLYPGSRLRKVPQPESRLRLIS